MKVVTAQPRDCQWHTSGHTRFDIRKRSLPTLAIWSTNPWHRRIHCSCNSPNAALFHGKCLKHATWKSLICACQMFIYQVCPFGSIHDTTFSTAAAHLQLTRGTKASGPQIKRFRPEWSAMQRNTPRKKRTLSGLGLSDVSKRLRLKLLDNWCF